MADDIVVYGTRVPTSVFWNGGLIHDDCEAWVNFMSYWDDLLTQVGGNSSSLFSRKLPSNFDKPLDKRIEAAAARIANEMAQKPDSDKIEYIAIIWKDINGNVHSTTIERGTGRNASVDSVWGQVDFGNGGQVVSIIHSHPTMYNAGSEQSPDWQPRENAGLMSSGDFDHLIDYASGNTPGFDSVNYRSFIVAAGQVSEYYAFDQNHAMYGAGGQATWSVLSTDYGQ